MYWLTPREGGKDPGVLVDTHGGREEKILVYWLTPREGGKDPGVLVDTQGGRKRSRCTG